MSPRHFSKPYGPYFVGHSMSNHKEHKEDLCNTIDSKWDKVKSFFVPRKKTQEPKDK
jgi:hypothetical protein